MMFDEILERFQAKRVGAGYMAQCPAHEDRNPSLSIVEKAGRILLKCQAGCETREVLGSAGLTFEDLREEPKLVKTYDYVDENKKTLYQVCRYEPKNFKQRKPDETADGPGISTACGECFIASRPFWAPAMLSSLRAKKTRCSPPRSSS